MSECNFTSWFWHLSVGMKLQTAAFLYQQRDQNDINMQDTASNFLLT